MGADILRLWVASADYRDDVRISDNIVTQLSDAYRRIRNTCRFMLGNLFDFDPVKDARPIETMEGLDRFILHRLNRVLERCLTAYDNYEFHTIHHALHNFCVVDLSAFYLDIIKDRLYTSPAPDNARRDAQTAMYLILDSITRLMAPILPFTAEEVWTHMPNVQGRPESVHLSERPDGNDAWADAALAKKWEKIRELRAEVTKALEEARTAKLIGHPLDASVLIKVPTKELGDLLNGFGEDLRDIFIVSSAMVVDTLEEDFFSSSEMDGLLIKVTKAAGEKCSRCWKYDMTVGDQNCHDGACKRCSAALDKIATIEG